MFTTYSIRRERDGMDQVFRSTSMLHLQNFWLPTWIFPFTHLGLPWGVTKPEIEHFSPMVQRIERRLTSCSNFLSQEGKLEMVNTVLTSISTYYVCTLKLPCAVIKQINAYRRHCLYRGSKVNNTKAPKAAWNMVCKPKSEGDLGVLNLRVQNEALLLKNLHKFFNKADLP